MQEVSGVILAGGMARRMGGAEKALLPLRGRALIEWVIERLRPQVGEVLISANREIETYARLGHRVVRDDVADADRTAGPLAGLLAGLKACTQPLLATAPCDAPLLPKDLVARLHGALGSHDVALAKVHDRVQPVFVLVRCAVAPVLEHYLKQSGRKAEGWYASLDVVEVPFDDQPEAFTNVNTPEELRAIEARLDNHGNA